MPDPIEKTENKTATATPPVPDKPSSPVAANTTIVDGGKAAPSTGLGLSAAIDKIATDKTNAALGKQPDPKEKAPAKKNADKQPDPKDAKKEVSKDQPGDAAKDKKDNDDDEGSVAVKDPMAAAKAKKEDEAEEGDITEKEIQEELERPHKNLESARRFRTLNNKWKAAESKVAKTLAAQKEKDAKLAALEKEMAEIKAGKGATDAEIEKEREELFMYRRRDQLENDPQVKETFDNRIKAADESIYGVLQRYGVKPDIIKAIQDNGGFEEYVRQNGEDAKKFLQGIELADSQSITSALTEKALIKRARGEHIRNESSKAKEYFERKAKEESEAKKNAPNPAAEEQKVQEVLGRWTENAYKTLEYFHTKEIPDDATAEEKKQIEAQNQEAGELRELLKSSIAPKTLQDRADIALAATLARRAVKNLKTAEERIASLEAELKELKEADETTPRRGGSITSGGTDNGKKKTPPKSLGEALDRLQSGESIE